MNALYPDTLDLADIRFQRAVARLHRLGARPLHAMLAELGARRMLPAEIETLVFKYAAIDPAALRAAGGGKFAPVPLHPVGNQSMTVAEVYPAGHLPTRPTKTSDSRAKGFGEISVELDAIEPDKLRTLVEDAIEDHLPALQFNVLKAAEKSERTLIRQLVGELGGSR